MADKRIVVSFKEQTISPSVSFEEQIISPSVLFNDYIGNSDKYFIFTQGIPSSIWMVEHTLNKKPSVTIVDTGDTIVYGDVTYLSNSLIQITFSAAFAGKAYLN